MCTLSIALESGFLSPIAFQDPMLEPIGIKEGEAEKVTVEGRIHEKASPLSDFGIHARVKIIVRSPCPCTPTSEFNITQLSLH